MTANPNEALFGQGTSMGAALHSGVEAISIQQQISFTKYVKVILPIDGYVFWLRADIVSKSALFNATRIDAVAFNKPPSIVTPAPFTTAKGSLHYATDLRQEEAETYAVNHVVFTSEEEIQDLNQIGPNCIFIAEFGDIRFAFSQRGSWYKQAQLWHYVGNAVFADMETQIVDSPSAINTRDVIVSNSLPAWLALNNYSSFYGFGNTIPLYPSFLAPTNMVPPFGTVHIAPERTHALASTPFLGKRYSHYQLASDSVKVTLWGCRNAAAQTFVDCVNQYSTDFGAIGIMNMPIVRDEKRTQVELAAIAQKKSIEFEVSYHQSTMRDIARQLIEQVMITYIPEPAFAKTNIISIPSGPIPRSTISVVSDANYPSGTYTMVGADTFIVVQSTPFTVKLRQPLRIGDTCEIKNDTAGGTVTVQGNGFMIDGLSSQNFGAFGAIDLLFNGTQWDIT